MSLSEHAENKSVHGDAAFDALARVRSVDVAPESTQVEVHGTAGAFRSWYLTGKEKVVHDNPPRGIDENQKFLPLCPEGQVVHMRNADSIEQEPIAPQRRSQGPGFEAGALTVDSGRDQLPKKPPSSTRAVDDLLRRVRARLREMELRSYSNLLDNDVSIKEII